MSAAAVPTRSIKSHDGQIAARRLSASAAVTRTPRGGRATVARPLRTSELRRTAPALFEARSMHSLLLLWIIGPAARVRYDLKIRRNHRVEFVTITPPLMD